MSTEYTPSEKKKIKKEEEEVKAKIKNLLNSG